MNPKTPIVATFLRDHDCGKYEDEPASYGDDWSADDTKGIVDLACELESALRESLKLQSHYATLLNQYDGGKRIVFEDAEAWS